MTTVSDGLDGATPQPPHHEAEPKVSSRIERSKAEMAETVAASERLGAALEDAFLSQDAEFFVDGHTPSGEVQRRADAGDGWSLWLQWSPYKRTEVPGEDWTITDYLEAGDFEVWAFSTQHDAKDPYATLVQEAGGDEFLMAYDKHPEEEGAQRLPGHEIDEITQAVVTHFLEK